MQHPIQLKGKTILSEWDFITYMLILVESLKVTTNAITNLCFHKAVSYVSTNSTVLWFHNVPQLKRDFQSLKASFSPVLMPITLFSVFKMVWVGRVN